jgi:hypothetical protein
LNFIKSQDCKDFFLKILKLVSDKESSMVDIGALFKKIGKLLVAFSDIIDD